MTKMLIAGDKGPRIDLPGTTGLRGEYGLPGETGTIIYTAFGF